MKNWPEVMVSFDEADGALYSADAFGKFGALSSCGFRGCDDGDWACAHNMEPPQGIRPS